jgi:hypothetical protein
MGLWNLRGMSFGSKFVFLATDDDAVLRFSAAVRGRLEGSFAVHLLFI